MSNFLIDIKKLSIFNKTDSLLFNVNFNIQSGEIVGLFGDSGSGKSVFSLFLLGLLNYRVFSCSAKHAFFKKGDYSFNLLSKKSVVWDSFRKNHAAMVFQDPGSALNPTIICGKQLEEVCVDFKILNLKKHCFNLFKEVGFINPEKIYYSFPHQLSGGQKQRVVIAISIATNPSFLVADEPTTSLDPNIQRSILDLILDLKKTRSLSVVLISHNIELIRYYADRVYVFKNSGFFDLSSVFIKKHINKFDFFLKKIKNRKPGKPKNNTISSVFNKSKLPLNYVFFIKNLSFFYKKRNSIFFALSNISFSFSSSDCLGVLGSSGSGKTTLGRILSGIEKNYTGDFFYPEKPFFLKNCVQMVYQESFSSFNPKYSIGNSISEIINLYNSSISISDLFSIVSLDLKYINSYPKELSGGQKQRASIARVLASNPNVIIFDESISALDLKNQYSILELIRFININLKITIIFISHDVNSVYYLCNKVLVLNNGKIVDFFKTRFFSSKRRSIYTKKLLIDSNFL